MRHRRRFPVQRTPLKVTETGFLLRSEDTNTVTTTPGYNNTDIHLRLKTAHRITEVSKFLRRIRVKPPVQVIFKGKRRRFPAGTSPEKITKALRSSDWNKD